MGNCRNHAGFTLIELLVVIAVIGVLAGLLLPVLQDSLRMAQQIGCTNNLRQASLSLQQYISENEDCVPGVWFPLQDSNNFWTYIWPNQWRDRGHYFYTRLDFDGSSDNDIDVGQYPNGKPIEARPGVQALLYEQGYTDVLVHCTDYTVQVESATQYSYYDKFCHILYSQPRDMLIHNPTLERYPAEGPFERSSMAEHRCNHLQRLHRFEAQHVLLGPLFHQQFSEGIGSYRYGNRDVPPYLFGNVILRHPGPSANLSFVDGHCEAMRYDELKEHFSPRHPEGGSYYGYNHSGNHEGAP